MEVWKVSEKLTKEQFRAAFPCVTAFADQCRKVFGNGVRLIYAEENGRSVGRKTQVDRENVFLVSDMILDSGRYAALTERSKKRGK